MRPTVEPAPLTREEWHGFLLLIRRLALAVVRYVEQQTDERHRR